MNVLVVGGNRFVGAELLGRLALAGHSVTVLALDPPPSDLAPHVRWAQADRNKPDALRKALGDTTFDAVFDNIAYEPRHVQTLAGVLRGRVGRYVLTSSVDVYPERARQLSEEESAPAGPLDFAAHAGHERYRRGKRACEKALRECGLPWSAVRPALVTGRQDNLAHQPAWRAARDATPRTFLLPARVVDGGPVLVRRDDQRVFKLVWAQDVARALLVAGTHPKAAGRAFNAVGDELWTTERLVRALWGAAGKRPQLVRVSARTLAQAGLAEYEAEYGLAERWSTADNRALRELGWEPTPAERWLPKLVETPVPPAMRPGWDGRLREIALAHHLMRRGTE